MCLFIQLLLFNIGNSDNFHEINIPQIHSTVYNIRRRKIQLHVIVQSFYEYVVEFLFLVNPHVITEKI